jgi:hypothetical protein
MNGTKITIPFRLIQQGNIYYLLSKDDTRDPVWCIKNNMFFASSKQLEGCNYFDREEVESILFDDVAEKWVRKSLPHRIPHKKAFIEGYRKAMEDFSIHTEEKIAEIETEKIQIFGTEGYTPKVSNGKIKIVSIR